MNILYLTFSFTTGGTERLLVDICQEMVKRHDNIHLYVINDHYDSNMVQAIDPKVKVTFGHKKPGTLGKIKAVLKLNKFIRKNKIDVIHCNAVNTLEMLFFKKLLYKKAKVLYTIHCLDQFANYKKKRIK
ncbi:MAG: glycosyltransferase, partial [Anaeroplasmataceae bacterium]|nr:glycosyltransferase [Anaeroplasmataceae bacterium]